MRKLRHWLQSFEEYASVTEAPLDCLYWTGVATVAGAMRRNVWIDMGTFIYTVNHYVIIVAPAGVVGKTTTADLGMRLLRRVGEPTPYIKFGPDIVTWQALAKRLAETKEESDHGNGVYFPHCSFTLASGEMGNLIDPQNREMLDLFVALWDARTGTFEKETKGSGNDLIVNPWLNMIACTTPSWIAGTFPEYAIGGGFTSRCIFVFADKKRDLVAYPKRRILPAGRIALEQALIHDLERISELCGEFRLTEEAFQWGEAWYTKHHTEQRKDIDPVRFGGYLSRKQGHIHKLAMVLSACQNDSMMIDAVTLQEAERIVTGTEANLHRVFELIGRSADAKVANTILDLIGRVGSVDRSVLHSMLLHRYGADEVGRGINSCLASGAVVQISHVDKVVLALANNWKQQFPNATLTG